MKLFDNPIFITQKRLVHRGGVLAAALIAGLVGASLLSGLIAYLADPMNFNSFRSSQEAGKMFYGWTIGVEILVLVIGGFSRISRVLGEERKAGLWDSNRMTPLKPCQLVTGYWLGAPLREFYMAAILAAIGLVIVLLGRLPITLWLGSQVLIFSTALFFGLLGVLVGMTFQRPQGGVIFLVAFIFFQFPSFAMPKYMLTNFLLPTYGIANLFRDSGDSGNDYSLQEWRGMPEIFGVPIPPILLSIALQAFVGFFLWRAAVRKTANPFQPPLFRWETVALFGVLLIVQNGLIWGIWRGQFPTAANGGNFFDGQSLLPTVHGGTLLLATVVLAFVSPQPESVRVKALRSGIKDFAEIFPESSVLLALVLTGVAAMVLLSQFAFSFGSSWEIYLVVIGNLLDFVLIYSLLLEFCRLRFRRRALGFVALWLFILCILPFILGGVFSTGAIAKLSLLAPGVIALGDPTNENMNNLLGIVVGHFGIAVVLFIGWQRKWKELLARAV